MAPWGQNFRNRHLARSASEGAPACDKGGCVALRSLGVGLLIRIIFHYPRTFLSPVHLLVNQSIGVESMAG